MSHRLTRSNQSHSRVIALAYSRALPLGLLVILCGLALLALASYGYYLNKAVEYASLRASSEEERSRLSAVVAHLEAKRALLVASLTLDRARELGLLEAAYPIFLTRGEERTLSLAAGTEGL
ncbi:MAG: hypothetical protein Q8R39_02070 [bacterium]|nr:hypothetical protein [bacterium]MDZ4285194.1 hypothetical protein [Patescibacteria group bacterium]